MAVVIADLVVGGVSHGPHGFVMQMRENGAPLPGILTGDMGSKTIGNDLDNAWIGFQSVMLPRTALLDRYTAIEADALVQRVEGISSMEMIGQRLYTGRTVIAMSALVFTSALFAQTRAYSDNKKCWAPRAAGVASTTLSDIPQLRALYAEAEARLAPLYAFVEGVEAELAAVLRVPGGRTPVHLADAVAAAKVSCIETAIELCSKLKQEVGSYALMTGSGFEKMVSCRMSCRWRIV
jgi:acyl-CoA oxidase